MIHFFALAGCKKNARVVAVRNLALTKIESILKAYYPPLAAAINSVYYPSVALDRITVAQFAGGRLDGCRHESEVLRASRLRHCHLKSRRCHL